jgi:RHS repeat-associated protein
VTAEADANGTVTAQYIYLNNHQPVTKLQGRDIYAIHSDHLGTPRTVTDEDQQLVWKADYSPFGKARFTKAQITLNLRFPGQYEDTETGTYYNYLRDYDPDTGRYTTSDPIGLKGGINTYAYVSGNPLGLIDPLGLAQTAAQPQYGTGTAPKYQPVPKPTFNPNLPASNDPIYRRPGGLSKRIPLIGRVALLANPFTLGVAIGVAIGNVLTSNEPSSVMGGTEATPEKTIKYLVEQIQQYDPGYAYLHDNNWAGARYLADLLHYQQVQYFNKFGTECSSNFDPGLYDKTKQDLDARIAISNTLYGSNNNQEDILERKHRAYLAEGGTLSYTDWVFAGQPKDPSEETTASVSSERYDQLSKDPQTGETSPDSKVEADAILEAEKLGIVQNARRPDLSKQEPNIDFKVDGGWADIKTPIPNPYRKLSEQASDIARKSNEYDSDVKVIINMKNLSKNEKEEFIKDLKNAGADMSKIETVFN